MSLTIPADVDVSALGIFNVKDPSFGAVGDGVTDDSPAIQSAINAAYLAGGGIVYLPSSRYLLNGGPITKGSIPGDVVGASCQGLAPAPAGFVFATPDNYYGPNIPVTMASLGTPGTLPAGMLPNGPLLLFDNVILMGDGPEQTILLAGEQIYNGWMFSPTGPSPGSGPALAIIQAGLMIATPNWWANYASDLEDFPTGYFSSNVYVRNLSVDCQGRLAQNAGKPLAVIENVSGVPTSVANPNIDVAEDGSPIGQLYGAAIDLFATLNCGVDNVWIYDGNVNGILIAGTQNLDAHANGPLPESFQQKTSAGGLSNLDVFIPPLGPSQTNVPVVNAFVTNCRIDLNFPEWLAGSSPSSDRLTGGSSGQLPIRAVGAAGILLAYNRVGQRNQPSNFSNFPPPEGATNFPDVSPNTNDAMDCPGAWHITILANMLTNCGDGIGSEGNGDMIIANNLLYNFGSVGVDLPSNSGKAASQTIISGNTFFLSSDSGDPQQAINFSDNIAPSGDPGVGGQVLGADQDSEMATAQQGSSLIVNNVFYGPGNNVMVVLASWGVVVANNIFDFGGITPWNQPLAPGSSGWPIPKGTGINVKGNDCIIEGNIFRNAQPAGIKNLDVIGIQFAAAFPPPLASGDYIRVLVKGNIFDKTIGVPIQDDSHGTDGLLGVRILDNIGANPPGPLSIGLVPFPSSGVTFDNPYPYDCFLTIVCGSTSSVSSVALNGVATGAKILPNNQKSFLVKAGGSIAITYGVTPAPTWIWVGL